jgi:hypothetical protein
MKGLKNFDFFQKIAVDNVTQPTVVGSFLSLSAISMIVFLLLREILDFFTPSVTKESIIYHDPDQTSHIKVNLEIRMPKVPCHMLSVDQEDSVGNHRMDISDTIGKIKINKGDAQVRIENLHQRGFIDLDNVVRAINEDQGCMILGHVPISKVPGDIHISHHNYADIFDYLKNERKDLFSKISLNHKVVKLSFGDKEINKKILSRFGFHEDTFHAELPSFEGDNKKSNYDYFIKLIPHLFIDKIRGETFMGYQYSVTSRSRPFNFHGHEMPIVIFHYDFSPITMTATLEMKSLSHALVHICAIVGGIYVIFSIINRILLSFCDFSSSDKRGVAAK